MDKKRVFVVDDDASSVMIMRSILERDGYDVVTAPDGETAVEMLSKGTAIDLIVLDVVLPKLSGVEVCREIKKSPQTAGVPIILVSAVRTDEPSVSDGLEAGADGYLTKPIEANALRAWVKAVLRISALQQELTGRSAVPTRSTEDFLQSVAKLSHAVNNPLQALFAAADLLSLDADSAEAQELIGEVIEQAEKVAELVARTSLEAKRALGR